MSHPTEHRPRSAALRIAAVLLALSPAACRGAGDAPEQGGMKEIGELLKSSEPVKATQVEGSEALETDPFALAEPGTVGQMTAPAAAHVPHQDPYIRFGERIIVRQGVGGEPFITKPYTMPVTKAKKLVELMSALSPFPFQSAPAPLPDGSRDPAKPLDPGLLEYQLLEKWDEEFYSNLGSKDGGFPPAEPAKAVTLSDLLVVTASYNLLEQFEEFLDLFAAGGVPQIELEAKIIEVVESDQLDVGGSASFVFGDSNFVQGIDFNLPNQARGPLGAIGTEAILDLGAVQSSFAFDALLEAVRTWDNVQIESKPKTVVRAGGVAYIESTTEVPFSEIKSITESGNFTASTVYKKVGVQLYISPRIIGTKMLALDVHLIGSQQVGTQVTFTSESGLVIEVPVIAYRTAKTVVYLEPGQTLVIGGLTTQRDRDFVNKVPILGDLPLLGLLFRSTFTRSEKQHVLFAVSPRILQHSDFEEEF